MSSAAVLEAFITRPSSPLHRFHHRQALRPRRDVVDLGASSPVPQSRCSTAAMGDIVAAPRPPPAAIKGALPAPKSSHHRTTLPLLTLLDNRPSSISHQRRPISSPEPPLPADHRRRLEPPRAELRVPGASSSTPTSLRTSPLTAGAPSRSPTPDPRRQ
jgi:hypothetical protein